MSSTVDLTLRGINSKTTTYNMFANTLDPNYSAVTKYTLMRGVTDFSNLLQFDLFETGYSFLICLKIPRFMDVLRNRTDDYRRLINAYTHILEYDFRGANGIEDISSDTNSLTNGITDINIITRVNEQNGSQFSMNYYERSGSIITKTHELYLRGVKDPRTQVKRYNGLLQQRFSTINTSQEKADGSTDIRGNDTKYDTTNNLMMEKGYHCEIFHFLLIVTDNTALNLEKAYLLTACQPTTAHTTIYNVTKGEIGFSELNVTFNGFPISGRLVNLRGVQFLDWINKHTCFDEMSFGYDILGDPARIGITGSGKETKVVRDITESPVLNGDEVDPGTSGSAGYSADTNVIGSDYTEYNSSGNITALSNNSTPSGGGS